MLWTLTNIALTPATGNAGQQSHADNKTHGAKRVNGATFHSIFAPSRGL